MHVILLIHCILFRHNVWSGLLFHIYKKVKCYSLCCILTNVMDVNVQETHCFGEHVRSCCRKNWSYFTILVQSCQVYLDISGSSTDFQRASLKYPTCEMDNVFPLDDLLFGLDTHDSLYECLYIYIYIYKIYIYITVCLDDIYRTLHAIMCLHVSADGGRDGLWWAALPGPWLSHTGCWQSLLVMYWL